MSSEPWFLEQGIPRFLDWNLLWREALGRFGKSPCLRLSNRWVSFQELSEDVEHRALLLKANTSWRLGALVLLPVKGEDFFAKLLAVWCAGGVAVPSRENADDGNVRPEGSVDFFWGEGEPVASGSRIGLPSSEWHAIYHTSGSTGEPRAIVRGWRQAIYEAGHYAAVLGLREGMDCTMLIHPTFGASTKHFLGCLLSGCMQSVPSVTGTSISGGDLLYGTPSQILAREADLHSGRCFDLISLTGEPCSSKGWEVIRAISSPGAKCLNALGGTETGVLINTLSDIHSTEYESGSLYGNGLPGKRLTVVGDDGAPLASGTPGHLLVESEWIAEGYLGPAEGGDTGFHSFENKGTARLFLTGDVVVEEKGRFRHFGRSGSMIKHRGEWIDTAKLRIALQGEGVDTFHLDRNGEGIGLRVWIRMERPDRELLKLIAEGLEERLYASPLLPEMLLAIREFPLNTHGKTDLRELARLVGTDEVLAERIPSRVGRIAVAITNCEWDSPMLKGAQRIGDLELDSLSLHELLLEIERLSGNLIPLWMISPATLFSEMVNPRRDRAGSFASLDGDAGVPVLLWVGDGVMGIRHEFGKGAKVIHWTAEDYPGASGTAGVDSMHELAERMVEMADSRDFSGRIVVGGFSAGAVMALEIARVLARQGFQPKGLLLLDPPDLDHRYIRSPWRWSRWRPSILCRLLGMAPSFVLDGSDGKLRLFLAKETRRHVRERRRRLMRYHQVTPVSIPTVLATSSSNHDAAIRSFGHTSRQIEILEMGVEEHLAVITDSGARYRWMKKLHGFLFDS
jgi:acyl-coenzyme A synthetase/AMP-(fatty) acid ligase